MSRAIWMLAACGVILDGVHAATGARMGAAEAIWVTWLPVGTLSLCGAAATLSVAHDLRGSRATRLLIGVAILCYAPGTALYTQVVAHQQSQSFPNLADFCWISFYPLALAALILSIRHSMAGRRPVVLVDAGIGALTAMVVGSVLLLNFVLRAGSVDGDSLGSAVYSMSDQLLVGAAIGAFAVYGWRPPRVLVILTIGFLLQAVEDAIYLRYLVRDVFPTDGWLITFWLANFTIISAAAVFGGRRSLADRDRRPSTTSLASVVFAAVLVLVTIAIMFDPHPWPVAIGLDSGALLLVVGRMGLALFTNARLLREARDDSRTDPLTSLGNRRDLHQTVECELAEAQAQPAQLTVAIYDLDGFKGYNDSYGHPAGDALLRRLATRLRASVPPPARAFRLGGDEFCVLIPERAGHADAIVRSCADALTESGDAFCVTSSYGIATIPKDASTLSEALMQADRRLYKMKMNRPLRTQFNAIGVLRRVLEEAEPEVQDHQTEVARLAIATGRTMGLSQPRLSILGSAAEFHDVGKIAIPDSILKKPGPLDDEEWAYMRRHTLIGERFLLAVAGMEKVATIVRSTHERMDGNGYPDNLRGDEIPLESRIISACDAFHAMTSDRPYSPACSPQAAVAELRRCTGTQFDARVVDALRRVALGAPTRYAAAA